MTLLLGAHVGQQNFEMDEMRALWRWLDGNGFDWISAWDHIYEAPPASDPRPGTIPHFEAVATLAAMAVETTNARLGCLVFYVGYRNPGLLAKAAITIDHLAGGRFELGLGAGWHQWEAEAYGYDFPSAGTRLDMLDEATQLIGPLINASRFSAGDGRDGGAGGDGGNGTEGGGGNGIDNGIDNDIDNDIDNGIGNGGDTPDGTVEPKRTSFSGNHFRLVEASCLPPPRYGSMPLWIGGVGEKRTLPMAARYADGWNAAYISAGEYGDKNRVLDVACQAAGRNPEEIERSVNLVFAMGADRAQADRISSGLAEQWGPMADRIRGGALIGTPEQAVDQVMAYAEAGAQMVNIALRAPFDDEALRAYHEVVMPQVRAEVGAR